MTLYKQLVAGMVTVLILLMICVFIIEFNTTRNNLEQQQRSEVSNTINTVGLALAPYLENKDSVAAESVINALFDGSTYSVVRLTFLDDSSEIVRTYPVKPSQVPQWFTNLNLFEPIHDSRIVTSGWLQLAEVEIISHPGEAYIQLWQALIRLCLAFGAITLLGLTAIALIVRHALKPLQMIVAKMEQIGRNQFGDPLPRPDTRDLIAVVDGINSMSAQVEKYFKAQAQEAQQLRERAYIDPVSQLGNRAYYMNQLNAWLSVHGLGGVAMLQVPFIKEGYEEQGYEAGDNMVRQLAVQLKASLSAPNLTLARISGSEFGFIIPNMAEAELREVASTIVSCVHDVTPDQTAMTASQAALGVVYNKETKTTTELLSLLDNALAASTSNPELDYGFIASSDNQLVMGKQQWKALVEEAIQHDWFTFRFQAANDESQHTFHREVFSAIEKDHVRYSANQYLFALEQLHATHLFDEYVLQTMVDKLQSGELSDTLAVNISQSSIEQPSFIRWVTQLLTRSKAVAHKLHFEIPESCFVNAPHHTALFCHALRTVGAEFGVDNYGRNFQSLAYINEFRPKYVKLDYLFTHHLDDDKQKLTLTSISRTAHDLGITTIASRVETREQLDFLAQHFVDVFQGFIFDR
ncbi:EAL domain-containing protein [Vibrio sp. CDRSL-10 TSBA]